MLFFLLLNIADCKNTPKVIDCEISGFIDFEEKKIWFYSTADDALCISLTGSTLQLDQMLASRGSNAVVRIYRAIYYTTCIMALPQKKPHKNNFVKIDGFEKTKQIFDDKGFIEIATPVYRISKDSVLSGPYILKQNIRLTKAMRGDFDETELLFFRVK